MELHLTSCIPPSVNHYLSYRAVMRNGKPMAMSYVTQEASKYKKAFTEYVIAETEKQGWDIEPNKEQHFYVDVVFYFDRTDRDCNNYFKCMLDAITDSGKIWVDDNVVCERVQRIYYDSEDPRIEMTIHPVDYIGVFDNAPQLESFRTNCVGCTRNMDSCSVYKKAVAGKIQGCVAGGVCSQFKKSKTGIKGE